MADNRTELSLMCWQTVSCYLVMSHWALSAESPAGHSRSYWCQILFCRAVNPEVPTRHSVQSTLLECTCAQHGKAFTFNEWLKGIITILYVGAKKRKKRKINSGGHLLFTAVGRSTEQRLPLDLICVQISNDLFLYSYDTFCCWCLVHAELVQYQLLWLTGLTV